MRFAGFKRLSLYIYDIPMMRMLYVITANGITFHPDLCGLFAEGTSFTIVTRLDWRFSSRDCYGNAFVQAI